MPLPKLPSTAEFNYFPLLSLVAYLLLLVVPPVLKLAGPLAQVSWWWVASPLWVVWALVGALGFVVLLSNWVMRALDL